MFRFSTELKLRDTDAAGVAFFASYYAIAHEAYETFLKDQQAPLHTWLDTVHLPIVHSEADYNAPVTLGTPFVVNLSCERLGDRSFTLKYEFISSKKLLAYVKTVHVAVKVNDEQGKTRSTELPSRLKSLLSKLMVPYQDSVNTVSAKLES